MFTGKNNSFRDEKEGPIKWEEYILERLDTNNPVKKWRNKQDTRVQFELFGQVAWALNQKGWAIEDGVVWSTIWNLADINPPK